MLETKKCCLNCKYATGHQERLDSAILDIAYYHPAVVREVKEYNKQQKKQGRDIVTNRQYVEMNLERFEPLMAEKIKDYGLECRRFPPQCESNSISGVSWLFPKVKDSCFCFEFQEKGTQ